jgi:hypothetical protein
MLKKIKIKLLRLLLGKRNVSTILISLGFAQEEYIRRYNDPTHTGYKNKMLDDSIKDLDYLQGNFANMLGIDEKDYLKYSKRC